MPNNAALVVAGNIPADELKTLAENKFGSWKSGEVSRPSVGEIEPTKAKIVIVDRPGAQQTMVRLEQMAVGRATLPITRRSK